MKIIRNRFIPPKGYSAMMICGLLFARKDEILGEKTINHEKIHLRQQLEMLFVFFFVWYLVEYMVKLLIYRNHSKAYSSISFEREAYANQYNFEYLKARSFWNFLKFM